MDAYVHEGFEPESSVCVCVGHVGVCCAQSWPAPVCSLFPGRHIGLNHCPEYTDYTGVSDLRWLNVLIFV